MPRHSERAALWLLVTGLHGVLLLALGDSLLPRLRDSGAPTDPQPMKLRLIAPSLSPSMSPSLSPSTAPADAPRAAPQPGLQVLSPRTSNMEPAMAPVELGIAAAPTVVEASQAASAPVGPPLNLSLPRAIAAPARPSMQDQMLNDPRSNTPRATIETRVAAVAGSVEVLEERMDATRLRVRQRGSCFEVHVSRDAQINPWHQSHSPTPKIVKPSC